MNATPNQTNRRIPAPTRASIEFPSDSTLTTLGIEGVTLDEARVIASALSLFIGAGRSKNRTKVGVMISMLVGCCHVEVARDGEVTTAAMPDLADGPWPHGKSVLA